MNAAVATEIERVRRTADMLCTGHAFLRDKYSRRALWLDILILASSTFLAAFAFADPAIAQSFAPFGLSSKVWIGLLGTATFFLSVMQIKTDWKRQSDSHARTLEMYAEVKREAGYLLASEKIGDHEYQRVISRYDMASAAGVAIPEDQFLAQKQRHRIKVEISKYLDAHPFSNLLLVRFKLWWRDNFGGR